MALEKINGIEVISSKNYSLQIEKEASDQKPLEQLPYITSSMLDGVNTCPKRGILRNVLRKTFTTGYRQMALEAGSLMHDVFSVLNLYQVGYIQDLPDHMNYHGKKEFGTSRWNYISQTPIQKYNDNVLDEATFLEALCLNTIGSSDFVDDPSDTKRTLANLETSTIQLIDYWLHNISQLNIYIEDKNNPECVIGHEMSIDTVITVELEDITTGEISYFSYRFVGLADAVYQTSNGKFKLGEFKTASTTNDAWRMAFETRHQITGYNLGLRGLFPYEKIDDECLLIGQAIPLLKTRANNLHFPTYREPSHYKAFANACINALKVIEDYRDYPHLAPMFTHSCNAYFRPCAYLDVCTSAEEDQIAMIDQMVKNEELSPSEEKAFKRNE